MWNIVVRGRGIGPLLLLREKWWLTVSACFFAFCLDTVANMVPSMLKFLQTQPAEPMIRG